MKYHVKTREGCIRVLEVQSEEEEFQEAEEKVFRDFERVARISGFRVGKAPRDLVRRHYEKEIREELLKRFVPELYEKALQASRLKAIALPEISELHLENRTLSFKAKVETEPEVPLRKYKGLKATRKPTVVAPEEIQKGLRAIQEQHAELVPKEGAVEEDDFVVCDVEGRVNGEVAEDRKNALLRTSKDLKHPELVNCLLGAKAGEVREAELALESPGGMVQKTHYKIQINEIKQRNLPEMNDAFVREVSRFQTVKELEEAVLKEIQNQKERERQRALERDLLAQLRDASPFAVPRLLVEQQVKTLAEEEHLRLKLLGLGDEEIETRLIRSKEMLFQEAETRVKNSLILEKIAETERIDVPPAEIDERIRALSSRLGRDEKEKEKDLAHASVRERIAGEILLEKALAIVVSHAQVKEA